MKLGHVALVARDPDGLADFYAGFLGLTKVAALDTEETGRLLLMASRPDDAPEFLLLSNPTARHVAFRVDTLAELRERYAAAGERSTQVLFSFDHGSTLSFYFLDPEGNPCELYWETGRRPSGGNRPVDLTRSEAEILAMISA
jgi:catechol-2,3-dioxygenase